MKYALFCVITQQSCNYLEDGISQNVRKEYHYMLHNIVEVCRSQLHIKLSIASTWTDKTDDMNPPLHYNWWQCQCVTY